MPWHRREVWGHDDAVLQQTSCFATDAMLLSYHAAKFASDVSAKNQ